MTTKGSAPLNPARYEKDALIQVWVDRRDLANIAMYLEANGRKVRFLAEIVRFSIELTSEKIKESGMEFFSETGAANKYITDRFQTNLNPGGKGNKNLVNNLLMDSICNGTYVPEQEIQQVRKKFTMPKELSDDISQTEIDEAKRVSRSLFDPDNLVVDRETKDSQQLSELKETIEAMIKK